MLRYCHYICYRCVIVDAAAAITHHVTRRKALQLLFHAAYADDVVVTMSHAADAAFFAMLL